VRPGMESREVHGWTAPFSPGAFCPVLFDTTQLALERTISGATQRQQALAANIANATTPGYQRVDVDFHGALAAAMGSSDASGALQNTAFSTEADRTFGAVRADGSTIDIDAEAAKLAANALDSQAAVEVAKTRNAILRSAMGVG
jgi:flagellar basal-body rod protein FlgB